MHTVYIDTKQKLPNPTLQSTLLGYTFGKTGQRKEYGSEEQKDSTHKITNNKKTNTYIVKRTM